jgi:hypothetical protein
MLLNKNWMAKASPCNFTEILRNKYLDELEESVGQAIIQELLDYFPTNHTNPSSSLKKIRNLNYSDPGQQIII